MKPKWTKRRWKQLKAMERLLIECESIDNGSGIVERLQVLIRGAKALRNWNSSGRRPSFMQFVEDLAIAELNPDKATRK